MPAIALTLLAATLSTEPPPPAAGPQLDVGPMVLASQVVDARLTQIDPGALRLQTCLAAPPAAAPAPAAPAVSEGQVMLQVRIRRGQVKLVTTTSVSNGLEWLAPCLERRLAEWNWPVDKGRVDVPITVSPTPEAPTEATDPAEE